MTLSLLDTVERYVTPRKSTKNQWNAPCPFCGGTDRMCIFPYESIRHGEEIPPHCWCRQCHYWGTAEMLLRDKEKISLADARAIIAGSKSITQAMPCEEGRRSVKTTPALVDGAPCEEWQNCGKGFCRGCKSVLWSPVGEKALSWLRNRGLSDETILKHNLGYNQEDRNDVCPQEWGLSEKLWLPRGIVIPYTGEGQLWKIEIRLPVEGKGKQRYHTVKGSANTLYGYEDLVYLGNAVLCEGVFDALVMEQALSEAGVDGTSVATGSTDNAHEQRWLMLLSICKHVIVAFDNDEAGDKASHYWTERLDKAHRWKPPIGDINEVYLQDHKTLMDFARSLKPLPPLEISTPPKSHQDCQGNPETSRAILLRTKEERPIPVKRERKQRQKTSAMCSADGCYGMGEFSDTLGGLWCPNCTLRRDLIDQMHALGFPRLQYSPGCHFVEAGEGACVSFAKSMSLLAVTLACKEAARKSGEIETRLRDRAPLRTEEPFVKEGCVYRSTII